MADIYVEALQNYLTGEEWRKSVETFIYSHCEKFQDISEMSHEHHAIWKEFQDIVENVLDAALSNIGGSIESLEKALDEIKYTDSRGPREDLIKEVVEKLMSFSDFEDFAEMMHQSYEEGFANAVVAVPISSNDEIDDEVEEANAAALVNMGFTLEAIQSVMNSLPRNTDLETLVTFLSACEGAMEEKPQYDYLKKFIKEAKLDQDVSDLNTKFSLAESILETLTTSGEHTAEQSELLEWARDMGLLKSDLETAFDRDIAFSAITVHYSEGLVEWYHDLERRRRSIEEKSIAGSIISDAELSRMAELDRIAAMGTADEQMLHSLISRNDQISREISALHIKCKFLISSNRDIQLGSLEELYFFLKEQVRNGIDLDSYSDEIHDAVYNLVPASVAGDVVTVLLDLCSYEDEQALVRSQINELLGVPSSDADSAAVATADGRMSPNGHAGATTFSEMLQEAVSEQRAGRDADTIGVAAAKGVSDDDYDRTGGGSGGGGSSAFGSDVSRSHRAESKGSKPSEERDSKGAKDEPLTASPPPSEDKNAEPERTLGRPKFSGNALKDAALDPAIAKYIEDLKARQKQSLQQLRGNLQRQREYHLRDLNSRLEKLRENKNPSTDEQIEIEDLLHQIVLDEKRSLALEEGITLGFKKKYLSEVKAIRAAQRVDISADAISAAHLEAARELRKKYEKDQLSLLESLESQRQKQRERIREKLQARKISMEYSQQDEVDAEKELAAMNREMNRLIRDAVDELQTKHFGALAILHQGHVLADANDDEKAVYNWLNRVNRITSYYSSVGHILMEDVVDKVFIHDSRVTGDTVDPEDQAKFQALTSVLMGIVADACEDHVAAEEAGRMTQKVFYNDRAKEEDVQVIRKNIKDKFTTARDDYDRALRAAIETSQAILRRRRDRTSSKRSASDGTSSEELSHDVINDAMNSFLKNPLGFNRQKSLLHSDDVKSPLSKMREANERKAAALDEERGAIRSTFDEKQKVLVDGLQASMMQQKKQLQQRLQRRQEAKSTGDDGEDARAIEREINNLEKAFSAIVAMLREQDGQSITSKFGDRISVNSPLHQLVETMNRMAQSDSNGAAGSSWNANVAGSSFEAPPMQTTASGRQYSSLLSASTEKEIDRALMSEEVKRISATFNEEQQRQDLLMKLQQTRQRQALQRKLLERKQPLSDVSSNVAGAVAGDRLNVQQEINIGPRQRVAIQKTIHQEAVKGLGFMPEKMSSISDINSAQKSTQSRGLSLGPLIRK